MRKGCGTSKLVPFQSNFKLTHYRIFRLLIAPSMSKNDAWF
jgi:hypothetical protein